MLTNSDQEIIFNAREALIQECMSLRGFEYPPLEFVDTPDTLLYNSRRWGPLDTPSNGYRAGAEVQEMEEASGEVDASRRAFLEELSSTERSSFYIALIGIDLDSLKTPLDPINVTVGNTTIGVPTTEMPGSCTEEAKQTLYGTADAAAQEAAMAQYLRQAQLEADTRAESSDQFRATLQKWSDCFDAAGYDARDPLQAVDIYLSDGPMPSSQEIDAATADIGCKQAVGLANQWSLSVQNELEAINPFFQQIAQQLSELRGELVERARQVETAR